MFTCSKGKKNKTAIDQTIFSALYQIDGDTAASDVVGHMLTAVKDLRRTYLNEYKQFDTFDDKKAYALYSLMDHYSAADNYLDLLYSFPDYNKEHLIAHDSKNLNVKWVEANNEFTFSLNELLGKINGKSYRAKSYRKLSANYIIIPSVLNSDLGHDDIVEKVNKIRTYYVDTSIPTHINVFLSHIENLDGFARLSTLKGQGKPHDDIKAAYKAFVTTYFSDENQYALYEKLENSFKNAFVGHP